MLGNTYVRLEEAEGEASPTGSEIFISFFLLATAATLTQCSRLMEFNKQWSDGRYGCQGTHFILLWSCHQIVAGSFFHEQEDVRANFSM